MQQATAPTVFRLFASDDALPGEHRPRDELPTPRQAVTLAIPEAKLKQGDPLTWDLDPFRNRSSRERDHGVSATRE